MIYAAYVHGEVYSYATDETNATPLLVYYMYVIALCYACSTKVKAWDGYIFL